MLNPIPAAPTLAIAAPDAVPRARLTSLTEAVLPLMTDFRASPVITLPESTHGRRPCGGPSA